MESVTVIDRAGRSFSLSPGAMFEADNADGSRRQFQFLGIMPFDDGCDFYLADVTGCSFLNVAASWFEQFAIVLQ